MANNSYVGEQCRASDECEYPATCENGQCACALKQMELTNEEFWIDPSLTIQCRLKLHNAYWSILCVFKVA